jgi:hypothetical protein
MIWTIKAILARHKGDRAQAIQYCADIASQYPHLATEYREHLDTIRTEVQS